MIIGQALAGDQAPLARAGLVGCSCGTETKVLHAVAGWGVRAGMVRVQAPCPHSDADATEDQEANARTAAAKRQDLHGEGATWDVTVKGAVSTGAWPTYGHSPDAVSEAAQAGSGGRKALRSRLRW